MIQRNEYPRPQMRRDEWLSLNGEWQFAFGEEVREKDVFSEGALPQVINVPFSYQYPASGIGIAEHHDVTWYKRTFTLFSAETRRGALLCFNGVDYRADVWLNGRHVGTHLGGFAPFCIDVSAFLKQKNTVVVRCEDKLTPTLPRGKQSWLNDRFGCWYTPNSGIWQSVWLEFFDGDYVEKYALCPNVDDCSVSGEIVTGNGAATFCKMTVTYGGKEIKTQTFSLDGKHTRYKMGLMEQDFVDESFWWTPEKPNLMYLDAELYVGDKLADKVHLRFGMRKISVDGDRLLLNNRPYYQRLILDQGYFKEGGLTATSTEALKQDILLAKAMGFNGARKHQKFEDPYFYYFADELGFLTWCEMPSAYNFNADEQHALLDEWHQIVDVAKNFTSVVCYVPLNESWGVRKILSDPAQQNFARAMYYATKAHDPSRLVSTNDGWENLTETDVVSIHDYSYDSADFEKKYSPENLDFVYPAHRRLMALGNEYVGQPVVFSEFGGIAMQKDSQGEAWGYNSSAADDEEFYKRYGNLMEGVKKMWFSGFCYTQLTDVQQEVNGLLDADHKPKFDVERIKKMTE